MEDRRVEQLQGIARQDVRDPGNRPRVQRRIVVVEAREHGGIRGERPRVQHRHAREQD
jgi:hypothetical protein